MSEVKRIDIKEFREKGYLQEANRRFFHPLGLALEVVTNDDNTEKLGGVWDYRDDPEGMMFGFAQDSTEQLKDAIEKEQHVDKEWQSHQGARIAVMGCIVEGIPKVLTEEEFIAAGFKKTDFPTIPYEYDLGFEKDDDGDTPALVFTHMRNTWEWAVMDGIGNTIYFHATSIEDAKQFAKRITCFEPNF